MKSQTSIRPSDLCDKWRLQTGPLIRFLVKAFHGKLLCNCKYPVLLMASPAPKCKPFLRTPRSQTSLEASSLNSATSLRFGADVRLQVSMLQTILNPQAAEFLHEGRDTPKPHNLLLPRGEQQPSCMQVLRTEPNQHQSWACYPRRLLRELCIQRPRWTLWNQRLWRGLLRSPLGSRPVQQKFPVRNHQFPSLNPKLKPRTAGLQKFFLQSPAFPSHFPASRPEAPYCAKMED